MSLQFILGNSGSGKTEYIYRKIVKEAAEDPKKDYLVIVPEQFTMQTQKQLVRLSLNHAIMNIDVLSFKRLAYRVFDELGIKNVEVLEETGKNLVLRKIASDNAARLGVMKANMNRIGYVSEVKSLLSEFVQYNISPAELKRHIESGRLSENLRAKLSDVLIMYEEFNRFMEERYITAEEILNVLSDVAEKSEILKDAVICFDEFTGFTPIQNELMKKLLVVSKKIYVTLTIDSDEDMFHTKGMHELFYMPKKTIQSLMKMADMLHVDVEDAVILNDNHRLKNAPELLFMEQNLFRKRQKKYNEIPKDIHIECLKDPKDELVRTAQKINKLIRQNGLRYRDIAVVTGDVGIYDNYIESIFGKYEIPYFIDTTKEILLHPFIEFIRSVPDIIEKDFSAESVLRFLRCGFCDIETKQIDTLENYLLATGIRGKKAWMRKWVRTTRNKNAFDPQAMDELRIKIMDILTPVWEAYMASDVTVEDYIMAIYNLSVTLDIQRKLALKEQEYLSLGMQTKSKEYGQIYRIIMKIFEKYVVLLGDEKMSVAEFTDTLDAGLDAAEVAVIPPGYDTVTIGDIERTRLTDIKVMFFIGVNDGVVPKAAGRGGIISQYERQQLCDMDIELAPGAREQAFIQKFYLYLNMTKPSEQLHISYSRIDGSGKSRQPSYIIGTFLSMFPKLSVHNIEDAGMLYEISTQQSAQMYLISADADKRWYGLARALELTDPDEISKYINAKFEHYSNDPISKNVAQAVYGRKIEGGITRFEQFCRCAYAHFLNYGLKLKEREEGEFSSLDIGNIYHAALERYSSKLEAGQDDWFTINDNDRKKLTVQAIEETIEGYPGMGEYMTAQNLHQIEQMKKVFDQTVWALTVQIRKGRFIPKDFEVGFSQNLRSDAGEVSLKGRIDRVDLFKDDGKLYVKILDYKSGNTAFDLVKIYYGTQLQLAVYMDCVLRQKEKENPLLEVMPGGMLYYHIDDPVIDLGDDTPDDMISEEEINTMILRRLKPDGLINSDENAYRGMDTDFEGASDVIPVKLKKDMTPDAYSKVASKEEIDIICDYAGKKLKQIADDIYNGDISVNPFSSIKSDSCAYCAYQPVCRIGSKLPGFVGRSMPNMKKDEVIDRMNTDIHKK
ncbi:MAG: PD-(D/E)XK nuclease family protein [Agathobacter sp.]|uniref:PD-(D/E)XK nuclease family protein n=1 Tax=Agathobacter sp. TaxID=2021311 RepID=UPI0039929F5A